MRLALIAALFTSLAGAADRYSAVASGVWSSTGSWSATDGGASGASVPGNGDKAIIRPTQTITVDVNTTVGQSAAMTGTVTSGNTAIAIGNGAAGTPSARLIIASGVTLHVRGNLTVLNSVTGLRTPGYWPLTISSDATLEFDTSAAVDPTQNYAFAADPTQASLDPDTVFHGTGTSGHPATITSNVAGGNGYSLLAGSSTGFYHSLTYTDIRRFGTASLDALALKNFVVDLGTNGEAATLDHVRFFSSGRVFITSGSSADSIAITGLQCTNPLIGYCLYNDSAAPVAPATKSITFSSNSTHQFFAGDAAGGSFSVTNWTLNDNLFYGTLAFFNDGAGSQWLSAQRNIFLGANPAGGQTVGTNVFGPVLNWYYAQYVDVGNLHGIGPDYAHNATGSIDGVIFDTLAYTSNYEDTGDLIFKGDSGHSQTFTIANSIVLPGADPTHNSPGNLLTMVSDDHVTFTVTNNTGYFFSPVVLPSSIVSSETTNPVSVGNIAIFKGNLAYSTSLAGLATLVRIAPEAVCVTDVLTPSGTAYNATYNAVQTETRTCATNQGNSYVAQFSATPPSTGSNVTSNPAFVDDNRGLIQAGIGLFSEAICPTWVTTTVYTYTTPGTTCVSTTDAAYFRGKTINWTLIATNTGDATNKPGALAGTWRTYWEPQGLYDLRAYIFSGATITVSGCPACTAPLAFLQWIRNGMAPTNPAYVNASAPLGYIGAMAPLLPSGPARVRTFIRRR